MIILIKRKRFTAMVSAIILAAAVVVGIYEITGRETAAVPAGNRAVIIDAGHGGADGGAVGTDGTVEKDLNLQLALKVQELLEKSGCTVFMTRSEDISLSTAEDDAKRQRKMADLNNRKKMMQDYEIDAFVSIHMNTFPQPQYKGTQVFYASKPEASKLLADLIQQEAGKVDSENQRVAKDEKGGIYILQEAIVPAVVVECGFLSNAEDLERLKGDEYQDKLATAIYNGIIRFFTEK